MYGRGAGRSFFNADDDSDEDDFSDEDEDIGALGRGGGTSYLGNQAATPIRGSSLSQQPLSPRPPSPPSDYAQQQPPTPPAGVEPNQYIGYRGISDKQKTAPRSASEYDPTQDPSYFKQQPAMVPPPPPPRDEPPQPRPRRGSRDDGIVPNSTPVTAMPMAPDIMEQANYNSREQFPTSIPQGDSHNDYGASPTEVYSASDAMNQPYYAPHPATLEPSKPPITVATEADRKTIKWLIIGLAIALVCVAALIGGITGWQLNRKNKDDSSSSGSSSGSSIPPTGSGAAGSKPPTFAPTVGIIPTRAPSAPPSLAPTGPAFNQELFDAIAATSPNGEDGLLDDGTVQNMAFMMTVNETFDESRLLQRYAMRVFYYSTNGPTTWIAKDGWDGSLDECLWFTSAADPTIICSSDVLQTLELNANGATGTLPAELSMLTALSRLYIKGAPDTPGLTGTLPDSLGLLTSMSVVVLNDHQFEGPLPDAVIAGWAAATVINIVGSGLTGPIPESVSGLSLCSNFLLDFNALTGTFPTAVGSMSALVAFGVSNNDLTGTLPALSIATMKTFSVATNLLTGPVPSFAGFPALVKLSLEGNVFSGVVDTCGSSATTLSCDALNCTCATCSCV